MASGPKLSGVAESRGLGGSGRLRELPCRIDLGYESRQKVDFLERHGGRDRSFARRSNLLHRARRRSHYAAGSVLHLRLKLLLRGDACLRRDHRFLQRTTPSACLQLN